MHRGRSGRDGAHVWEIMERGPGRRDGSGGRRNVFEMADLDAIRSLFTTLGPGIRMSLVMYCMFSSQAVPRDHTFFFFFFFLFLIGQGQ